ncbi:MAG: alpha-galactosidase, partial [Spirochaetaceae bacterium]|nr:alpha-galactosidase [Spirochaetaceae bacterium]
MPVVFEKCAEDGTSFFLLNTPNSSYIISVLENGIVSHSGWGWRIEKWSGNSAIWKTDRGVNLPPDLDPRNLSLDTVPQEYSTAGKSDFRPGAIELALNDGTHTLDLRYFSHDIIEEKPQLEGLPATYSVNSGEVETLAL